MRQGTAYQGPRSPGDAAGGVQAGIELSSLAQHRGAWEGISIDLAELLWAHRRDDPSLSYEVQERPRRTKPVGFQEAIRLWRKGEVKFFGVVPRKTPGNRKGDCVDDHNVLWADIDREPGIDPQVILDQIRSRLSEFDLWPSAIVFSGRAGLHLYWVLSQCLPIEEIEGWNKVLAQQLDGDSCGESNRLLRIPGTVNEKKGGQQVELLEISGCVHDPSKLRSLSIPPNPTPDYQVKPHPHKKPEWLRKSEKLSFDPIPTDQLDGSCLLRTMNNYLNEMPKRGWRSNRYKSRSEIEQAIIYRLVDRGASDEQITELADECFARHLEERWRNPTDPGDYLRKSISSARELLYRKRGLISSPGGGWPKGKEAKYRHLTVSDLKPILLRVRGQTRPELVAEIQQSLGCSRSSAYSYVKGLLSVHLVEEKGGRLHLSSTAWRWKRDQTQFSDDQAVEPHESSVDVT